MALFRYLVLCGLVFSVNEVAAARLDIPLRVSLDTLREALSTQLASYRDGPCRYLRLRPAQLQLQAEQGRLRLAVPGRGALGMPLSGQCQTAAAWQGTMHFTLEPQIDNGGRLRMRIVDSRLVDARGGAAPVIWDLAKRHVHPQLERFSYDLNASRQSLSALLRGAAPPEHAAAMQNALQQLEVMQPQVDTTHVIVPIGLEIPQAWLAAAPPAAASGAPLTEVEVEALEKALEPWDSFLLYVVRQVGLDGEDSALRQRLFTLLLDSRYQLSALLAGDAVAEGDPVRALFLETWQELRTILVDARYAIFVDAADALAALETAAPGLPLSAEGLRQLARSLRPGESGDPLAYDWAIDPQLGQLFDVELMQETEPAAPPSPPRSWLDWLISRAHADNPLDHWVPTREELANYRGRISGVLQKSIADELQRGKLAAPYDRIYRHLMPTTALIESCWRQYVVRGGKVTYLRSQSSSVGIMQINQRVWRGFYDVERLRWDTAYNIRAGSQILARYLKDYAIPYAERTGKSDDVARAAYAVYNAGPRAVGRFNKSPPHPREARVDEKLWSLYQGIASGGQVDLATCGVTTRGTPSAARGQ